ncbi:Endonuclease/Exonuclease/phosphatase family protein [Thalassovita gelatinovora]|uniref:Endonuclease/Exonuclease/phosphatase family protein n=1 Tax=Thalassovita gelatinovora TaxID=53501 RepID=A0A0P1FJI5_THAGE|nr:endonuclease/exonuclease/phosphatase family protein [Thalassovita gelatinovora]QIZ81651.1 endonuclease/exonuclease/phosphatase family protein [Thalassovita gelatinovora]CUH68141.1 Endonuclease/Exonuclease/phosphatase family protein [Thalassovita gelatinovora]SEQ30020.1 Endonuclease/Exonuclease/phosphatase family protein [Thalassovita gelatinovora]
MRIATFNLQNLRLRGTHLDGARDGDVPQDHGAQAKALDRADRALTAQVIRDTDADILALQEVFNQPTLDHFNTHDLAPLGADYPFRTCLPGNDGRGLDVGLMSRIEPALIRSHADLTPQGLNLHFDALADDLPIFRRDVLLVEIGPLTLFICHFKAPYPDSDQVWAIRRAEAQALRTLITREIPDHARALWMILGDLNEPARNENRAAAIAPLRDGFAVDLLDRIARTDRWSWHNPIEHLYGHPDAMLASPALARRWPDAIPRIIRSGMGLETRRNAGPHLPGVGHHRPHASDHAAVVVELSGI